MNTPQAAVGPASVAGFDLSDPALDRAVRIGLAEVEERLRTAATSADPFVTETARHLAQAGGKRFRPLLVLLGAQFGADPTDPAVVRAATVVELTHLATLYHDDVMDEASVRRGAPSANTRWTNTVAILTGDYLLARAADIAAELGPEAVRIQARTFARLVQGQIQETAGPRPTDDPVEHYLHVLAEKTASLFATALRFGGMFAAAPAPLVEAMATFGEEFGVLFQLSDDILDIASDTVQSGKTPGTDLREGIATLPVLYALAGDDPAARRLREIVVGPVTDDGLRAEALDLLRGSAALDQARETIRGYADRALTQLASLPDTPARRALENLTTYLVTRTA